MATLADIIDSYSVFTQATVTSGTEGTKVINHVTGSAPSRTVVMNDASSYPEADTGWTDETPTPSPVPDENLTAYTKITTVTDDDYVVTTDDVGSLIVMDSASPHNLTVNTGLGDGFNFAASTVGGGAVTVNGTATVAGGTTISGDPGIVSFVGYDSDMYVAKGDIA